jgi:hypothetical protein
LKVKEGFGEPQAGERKFVAELQRIFVPAEVLCEGVSTAQLGLLEHHLTFFIGNESTMMECGSTSWTSTTVPVKTVTFSS